MSDQHPLTETDAAVLWGDHAPSYLGQWRSMSDDRRAHAVHLLRAAHNAGRAHEREHSAQDHPAEVTDEMRRAAVSAYEDMAQVTRPENHEKCLNAALEAAIATAPTPAAASSEPLARTLFCVPEDHDAPHHDVDQIRPGDFVWQMDWSGVVRAGIAHRQDRAGDWEAENGYLITWASRRADRPDAITVWPAPTPPAEEVELPGKHPAHITDVETDGGHACAYMALDLDGDWCGVSTTGLFLDRRPQDLAAFTLPDGTRVRRDGEHEDGTPRFIQAQEEEK